MRLRSAQGGGLRPGAGPPPETRSSRLLARADAALNRLYSWRGNPLYQSGTIAVLCLLLLLITGVWLLLFYRVGAPWASVARVTANPWTGNWVRGLHRYASDVAVVAALIHAFRMFAQGRDWGPRALAWVSGLFLLGMVFVSGWTGYVMVWDSFGRELALEGARLLDALPVLSEPVSRAFAGEHALPSAFFFLNLFAHIAVPLGLGLGLWLHVSRVARPTLLPPRPLTWSIVALLTAVALLWPLRMAPEADALSLPATVPADWFFAFWLPVTRGVPAGLVWLAGLLLLSPILLVPWLRRHPGGARPRPSHVDQDLCTGCRQCSQDCPYDAITMLPRTDGRADVVAGVDPDRCVSCGICAGSCAPMGIGPPGRTGRNQLEAIRAFLRADPPVSGGLLVVACSQGPGRFRTAMEQAGARVFAVDCAGNLHTSTIEFALRAGMAGVMVLSCPPRDCWNREGPRWLHERVYHGREAELKDRVDRRRIRIAAASAGELRETIREVVEFQNALAGLEQPVAEAAVSLELVCEPAASEEA